MGTDKLMTPEQLFPYVFSPTKTLTTKELTEVLSYFFAVKPVSQGFYDNLPDHIQQHFNPLEENK